MRFMVLVNPGNMAAYEAGDFGDPALFEEMGKFNEKLVDAGVMLAGEGLHPSSRAMRIHFPGDGKRIVTDGPFTETRELIGGFWIWELKSREEALEWAKRAPMEDGATLEIRQIIELSEFGPEVEAQESALRERIESRQNS